MRPATASGPTIRGMRVGAGMDRQQLARRVGITDEHLRKIEAGQRVLTVYREALVLRAIADWILDGGRRAMMAAATDLTPEDYEGTHVAYSVREAAMETSTTPQIIRDAIYRGDLRVVQVGLCLFIRHSVLASWASASAVASVAS